MSKQIRLPEVVKRSGFSCSKIYLLIRKGQFPKQTKLIRRGRRLAVWDSDEIDKWVKNHSEKKVFGKNTIGYEELQEKIGLGRTSIYLFMKKGLLPRPVYIENFARWFEDDIEQWLSERIANRDKLS